MSNDTLPPRTRLGHAPHEGEPDAAAPTIHHLRWWQQRARGLFGLATELTETLELAQSTIAAQSRAIGDLNEQLRAAQRISYAAGAQGADEDWELALIASNAAPTDLMHPRRIASLLVRLRNFVTEGEWTLACEAASYEEAR